ncbi:MAG: NUDIX hydrolase [Spirochaetota bacterium]
MQLPDYPTAADLYPVTPVSFCPACGKQTFQPELQINEQLGFSYPHRFQCTACGFTFFINAAASTMALIEDPEERIVLLKRLREPKKGSLDLPGGFLAPGETAENGVHREVWEETNLNLSHCRIYEKTYCNTYLFGGVLYQTLDIVFICQADNWDELQANDPEEGKPVLIAKKELDVASVGLDSVRRFLTDYLASYR